MPRPIRQGFRPSKKRTRHGYGRRTDEALLGLIAGGDEGALEEVIDRHGARVRNYLGYVLRNDAWADDVTQEVFVRLFERATGYDQSWAVSVWLLRIARNVAVDLMRREEVRARAVEAARSGVDEDVGPTVASTLEVLEQREFHDQLAAALAQLPETFRSTFVLREIENMSYEGIAAVMNASLKTVSTRLHRARVRLRELLARYLQ